MSYEPDENLTGCWIFLVIYIIAVILSAIFLQQIFGPIAI